MSMTQSTCPAKWLVAVVVVRLAFCCGGFSALALAQSDRPSQASVQSANSPQLILIPTVPEGFVTKSFSLKPGAYQIVILNRTGARGLDFEFEQITNSPDT